MSSTRLRNQPGEYTLEQKKNSYICDNRIWADRTTRSYIAFPELGFNVSHIPNNQISHNATDIESNLYGIGSTNLIKPKQEVIPQLKSQIPITFFSKPNLILPIPFHHEKGQRPIIP